MIPGTMCFHMEIGAELFACVRIYILHLDPLLLLILLLLRMLLMLRLLLRRLLLLLCLLMLLLLSLLAHRDSTACYFGM